jgi:hypothetical protein
VVPNTAPMRRPALAYSDEKLRIGLLGWEFAHAAVSTSNTIVARTEGYTYDGKV